jgi:hypothetical protein
VITLFVLIAEILEHLTVSRGRRAIRDLMDLLPRFVSVRRADGVHDTSTDDLIFILNSARLLPSARTREASTITYEPDVRAIPETGLT